MRCQRWMQQARWLAAIGALSVISAPALAQEESSDTTKQAIEAEKDEPNKSDDEDGRRRIETRVERFEIKLPDHWIGLACDRLTDEQREEAKLEEGKGLQVQQVLPESPAQKAGVKEGDILLEARGKSLGEPSDLVAVVSEAKDEEFELTLIREGNKQTIRVKPEKRPEGTGSRGPEDVLFGFFGGEEGDQPVRMRFIHPGMFFPPAGIRHELPDDVRVQIVKEGKAPAEVEVRRGEKAWKIKENDLKDLPEDLRPHIAAILGQGPMPGGRGAPGQPFHIRVPGPVPFEARPFDERGPGRGFGGQPGDDRMEDRLDEMNRRLREMREELNRFREDGPRRERPARPRAEDRDPDDRRPEPRRADRPRDDGRGPDADGNEERPRRRPPRDEDRPGRPPLGDDRRDDDRPGEEA